MTDKKLIQQEAENVAYTYKGLYKTADYYKSLYSLSTGLSFLIGLYLLGFDVSIIASKILGGLGVLSGIILLMYQKETNDIEGYRQLANEYLAIYKDLQEVYYDQSDNSEKFRVLREKIKKLDKETSKYNISIVGRWWSKKRIKSEMSLEWIYEDI